MDIRIVAWDFGACDVFFSVGNAPDLREIFDDLELVIAAVGHERRERSGERNRKC